MEIKIKINNIWTFRIMISHLISLEMKMKEIKKWENLIIKTWFCLKEILSLMMFKDLSIVKVLKGLTSTLKVRGKACKKLRKTTFISKAKSMGVNKHQSDTFLKQLITTTTIFTKLKIAKFKYLKINWKPGAKKVLVLRGLVAKI